MQANVSQLLCSHLKSEVACSIEQKSPNDDQLNVVVKALVCVPGDEHTHSFSEVAQ